MRSDAATHWALSCFFLCGVTRLILGAQVDLCDPFYKIRAHNRLRLVSRDFKRSKPGKKRTHTYTYIYIIK